MKPELLVRVNQTWAEHFHLPPGIVSTPGTTLYINNDGEVESPLVFWSVDKHVVVETLPTWEAELQQILARIPPGEYLTLDDLKNAWGKFRSTGLVLYALDVDLFRPFAVPAPFTLRHLTPDDQPAFDTFLSRCSPDEREEGEVAIDHDIAFGIFDGERIVAASSVFVWRGFIDIGILTDPAYRGKGLGKAAVSVCCEYYLPGDLIVGYRHDIQNRGSQGIASGLAFSYYGAADAVVPPEK